MQMSWPRKSLLIYLSNTSIVVGLASLAIHFFFSHSVNQQLNAQMLTLAQAATPSLGIIKTQGRQTLDRALPWKSLFLAQSQSLEWFDSGGTLITREGGTFPSMLPELPFKNQRHDFYLFERRDQLLTITMPIFSEDLKLHRLKLQGYIRVSESAQELESTIHKLWIGLIIGSITALLLMVLSGIYLTKKAIEPLEKRFQRLRQFTVDASHELRNPLTQISIATEVILSSTGQVTPADSKELAIITTATEQMQRLIEDMLFLSRAEANFESGATFKSLSISLDDFLFNLIEHFQLKAQTKAISIQTQLESELSVKGDANLLHRLFSILLENALKYTAAGGQVSLSVACSDQNAIISVEDTGIGIPSEYHSFIFQKFWRSDQLKVEHQQGLGLGLAIAQVIAKQHGGEVTLDSQVGVGSTFRVRLPLY